MITDIAIKKCRWGGAQTGMQDSAATTPGQAK